MQYKSTRATNHDVNLDVMTIIIHHTRVGIGIPVSVKRVVSKIQNCRFWNMNWELQFIKIADGLIRTASSAVGSDLFANCIETAYNKVLRVILNIRAQLWLEYNWRWCFCTWALAMVPELESHPAKLVNRKAFNQLLFKNRPSLASF